MSDKERKRAFKKQVRDQERHAFLISMPISAAQAADLIDTLSVQLERAVCDETFRGTTEWCGIQGLQSEPILNWLRAKGGFCDCEVVFNVSGSIEESMKETE